MTNAAVTGEVPVVHPSSSSSSSSTFIAVAAGEAHGETESTPTSPFERRALARRQHDAAVAAVVAGRHEVFAGLALAVVVLSGHGWYLGGKLPVGWSVVALGVTVGCAVALTTAWRHARPGEDSRSSHRRLALVFGAMMCVLAVAPWTVRSGAWAPTVVAFVIAGAALVSVSGLAPLKDMAAGAVVLALSPGAANLLGTATPLLPVVFACVFFGALAALLAVSRHRGWLACARASFEQEDRIRVLEAARDRAVKADQEKTRFLAIASHDLRQPVHAIGLFAATLEKRLEGSAQAPVVRNLNCAIDGLDRSFNAMLDISRLDAGAIEPRFQHFALRDIFRRVHMHFAGQADQKGLGLRFSPGGKSISSDPQLLERILGNLVQNAIKYTERGGVVVVARSTPTHIHVEIWDTGIGIRASELPKVFDEFYQVGHGERVRTRGLGMGLAIVKRLVRLLGHGLTISSRPGKGTMFRLRIALGGLPEIQDVTAAADTLPMTILQPRTVLVLDDEEAIRDGLCLLLQEWGYDTISAGSIAQAESAVALLDAPPDLILCDLHLGDGPDGIAGIEAIRQRCGCDVAAMLITGDTSHAELRRATESGYPVLLKPVLPRKLYDVLRGLES